MTSIACSMSALAWEGEVSFSKLIQSTNVLVSTIVSRFAVAGGGGGPAAATPPAWFRVACDVPKQEETLWCWCATTVGVEHFYNPASTLTQCQAANHILGRADACILPRIGGLNRTFALSAALGAYGRLRGAKIAGVLTAVQVQAEIASGVPACSRVGWSGGGGHFTAINGFLPAAVPRVAISDPDTGQTDIDYSLYCTSYQGTGTWSHSYLTK